MNDAIQRFSDRVTNYVRYRPSYPPQVLDLLRDACGLTATSVVADVGSGTGILTRLLLENGNTVYGVEPNGPMRSAAEEHLAGYPFFTSIDGRAEKTTLPDHSVDFITAAQSFHWFERSASRKEFARVLRPAGWVVLLWNARRKDSSPFQSAYEQLLQTYATDYSVVDHSLVGIPEIAAFFGGNFRTAIFDNKQTFDLGGLQGRLLSSSYAPQEGHPNHAPMMAQLRAIFDLHQREGTVGFQYDTQVFYGQLC